MQRWEYKVMGSDEASHLPMLNMLGADGWELVALERYHAIFKRPAVEPLPDEVKP